MKRQKCRSPPVSRVLSRGSRAAAANIPLVRALPRASSELDPEARPGRSYIRSLSLADNPSPPRGGGGSPPYSLLHRVGFAVPRRLPGVRCALTAPFHPCHALRGGIGRAVRPLRLPRRRSAVSSLLHFPAGRPDPSLTR